MYWPAVALFLHHHHHQLWFYSSWSQPSLPPGCAWFSHVLSAASHQQTEASEMRRTSKKWKYILEFPFSQLLCPTLFLQCHGFLWPTITCTWINLNIGFIGPHLVVRCRDFKAICKCNYFWMISNIHASSPSELRKVENPTIKNIIWIMSMKYFHLSTS